MRRDKDDQHSADGVMKVVGRRKPGSLLDPLTDTREKARSWRKAFPTPFVPKGVYRFSSHQEAQEWLTKMITRKR